MEPFCLRLAEYKRARQEIKKKSSDTLKLQKKAKKGNRNEEVTLAHTPVISLIFILKQTDGCKQTPPAVCPIERHDDRQTLKTDVF